MLLLFSLLHLIGVQLWGQSIASILQPADTTYYQICALSQGNFDEPVFNLFSTDPAAQHFKAAPPNGIYLLSYIADGIIVSSAKVVVQH